MDEIVEEQVRRETEIYVLKAMFETLAPPERKVALDLARRLGAGPGPMAHAAEERSDDRIASGQETAGAERPSQRS